MYHYIENLFTAAMMPTIQNVYVTHYWDRCTNSRTLKKIGVQIQGLWKKIDVQIQGLWKKKIDVQIQGLWKKCDSDLNAVHALILLFLVLYHVILTVGQHGNVNILNWIKINNLRKLLIHNLHLLSNYF